MPKGVRTAEISNWSGKAIVAPRSDLEQTKDFKWYFVILSFLFDTLEGVANPASPSRETPAHA